MQAFSLLNLLCQLNSLDRFVRRDEVDTRFNEAVDIVQVVDCPHIDGET